MDLNTPEIVTLLLKHTSRYEELLSKRHRKTVCLVQVKNHLPLLLHQMACEISFSSYCELVYPKEEVTNSVTE